MVDRENLVDHRLVLLGLLQLSLCGARIADEHVWGHLLVARMVCDDAILRKLTLDV